MEYSEQAGAYYQLNTKNTRYKIGIMGGTFNPVHVGHVYMAGKAREEFGLDNVLFIPTGTPPHKVDETVADREHRYTMLELAIKDVPYFGISRMEIMRNGATYTVDTLRLLHRSMQDSVFYFIIGADTLLDLHLWKQFDEVVQLTEFICFLRPGANNDAVRQYIEAIYDKYKKEILVSSYEGLTVSSREIREKITEGKSIRGLVDENVEKYIFENGVYR
jgi:nicotinate-nucleotide adenylyltransferase